MILSKELDHYQPKHKKRSAPVEAFKSGDARFRKTGGQSGAFLWSVREKKRHLHKVIRPMKNLTCALVVHGLWLDSRHKNIILR